MNTGDILLAACDVLDKRGWCQGLIQNGDGNVCALGALALVCTGDAFDWMDEDFLTARSALMEHLPCGSVSVWNNRPGRTAEDVKELFAKTAADIGSTHATFKVSG